MDEMIGGDVSGGAPATGVAESPAAAPTSGGMPGATPAIQDGGTAVAPAFQVPDTDADLQGRETQPYVKGLLEARRGFRELYGKHQELQNSYQQASQLAASVEQMGGMQVAQQAVDLISQLFSPQLDQYGQQMQDPQSGLPITTSAPFVQSVAEQSWDVAMDMTEQLLALPTATGEPVLAAVMRNMLGLDPALIDTYRQISSPSDAAAMGLMGDIQPVELETIPQEFHDTYRRMTPDQRAWVQDSGISSAQQMQRLSGFRDQHRMADLLQRNEQMAQQQQEQANQQWQAQVEAYGDQAAFDLWDTHAGALMNDLERIQWSADQGTNQRIQQFIAGGVAQYVMSHPEVAPLRAQAYELAKQSARLRAANNIWQANQAAVRSQALASQVAAKAAIYMSQTIQGLQDFRGMASQAANGANSPRPIVSAQGQNGPGQGNRWQPSPGTKLLSPEYFKELTGGS